MKKISIIIAAAASILLIAGCNKDQGVRYAKYITVSASPSTKTVVSNGVESFASGDKISVYAWTGTAASISTTDLVVNNSVNTYDGTAWAADPQMLWKDQTTAHFFMARYPEAAVTNFTSDAFTVDPADQEKSDLLVAVNTGTSGAGLTATNNPVPLIFDHVMAKFSVVLSFRNQWGVDNSGNNVKPSISGVTVDAVSTATVDYISETATPTGTAAAVTLPETGTGTYVYQSVMVPQSVSKVVVKSGTKTYTYNSATAITLEKGKSTSLALIVGRDEITLGSVTIHDWSTGTTNNGEAPGD